MAMLVPPVDALFGVRFMRSSKHRFIVYVHVIKLNRMFMISERSIN